MGLYWYQDLFIIIILVAKSEKVNEWLIDQKQCFLPPRSYDIDTESVWKRIEKYNPQKKKKHVWW